MNGQPSAVPSVFGPEHEILSGYKMTTQQIAITLAARITLLVGAVGLFMGGALTGGALGYVLVISAAVVSVFYVIVRVRTRRVLLTLGHRPDASDKQKLG